MSFILEWTVIEDELLKLVVNEKGTKSWINISLEMNGRTAKQCRSVNYLSKINSD